MTASTLYRWPPSAHFGRVVPKSKFYERVKLNARTKEKFVAEVKRITWAYKLADSTIHLTGSADVPEIQVFSIDAKGHDVSKPVFTTIDTAIRFPTIFEINREQSGLRQTRMTAAIKLADTTTGASASYYSTPWLPADSHRTALPTTVDLHTLYRTLIAPFLPIQANRAELLIDTAVRVASVEKLRREITSLQRRLRNEPQFNRKVEIDRELRKCTDRYNELANLTEGASTGAGKDPGWTD